MKDINDLIIDENSITNSPEEDFEILSEWTVDPKKKEKLVSDAVSKLQKAISSDSDISEFIKIYTAKQITTANKNIYTRKKKYNETKKRKLLVGYYNFGRVQKHGELYTKLKSIVADVNSQLTDIEFQLKMWVMNEWYGTDAVSACSAALINVITAASRKNKLGIIGIKIKSKDSIREEFCNEALDFTDDIMNDLF